MNDPTDSMLQAGLCQIDHPTQIHPLLVIYLGADLAGKVDYGRDVRQQRPEGGRPQQVTSHDFTRREILKPGGGKFMDEYSNALWAVGSQPFKQVPANKPRPADHRNHRLWHHKTFFV